MGLFSGGTTSPHPRALRPSRCVLAIIALLTPMLCAMQCTNEDLTQRFTLSLHQEDAPQQITIHLPYTGRLALDVGVDAQNSGKIELKTQAQTSGDPDIDGCDAIANGRTRNLAAAPWNGNDPPFAPDVDYPVIGNLSTRTRITLPYNDDLGANAGVVELATDHNRVRLYTTDNDVSLWDLHGNIVPPIAVTQAATCDGVWVTIYELPAQHTRIAFRSDQDAITQIILQDCAANRIVDRVCPGSYGDIQSDTLDIDATQHLAKHYATLGVGDTLLLEASCQSACPATLELYGWVQPLQCKVSSDCSGKRVCTEDGYCIRKPPPSCASNDGRYGVWLILAFFIILLAPRIRRRSST